MSSTSDNADAERAWWAQAATPSNFGKFEVRDLLTLIFGEGSFTDVTKLLKWRSLIMYACAQMRSVYEARGPECPVAEYYAPCWVQIARAQNDDQTLAALENLHDLIRSE